ncbi:MAG TPA: efflux RND transporter periplasmic adaptor subunit [Ideonella sp.]|nr:efflux RND transporter periplasmic adaptor subunit [Ideonella sp.]
MKRTLVALSVVCALGLAACSRKQAAPDPVRAVRTLVVAPATASSGHDYAAEVRARTESRLGFRVGGKLQRRPVDAGDSVKAGQLLAQLDPQDLQLGQDAARAATVAAQTNLDQVLADYKRSKELRDQGFIGAAELERRDTAVRAARAQLDQAKAQAGVQGNQAGYAALRADTGGVITAVEAEPGQVVAAGAPVVRLAHDGPRDAVFSVPEDRVGAVRALLGKPGAVALKLWGSAEATPAEVREVAAAADPVTRTFLVKADVGKAPVRLGQTATLRIAAPLPAPVIRLPLSAVVEAKGQTVVWLLERGTMTVRTQPIAVAGADGNAVIVASGLKAGDEVVTAGTHVLTPGLKVKPFVEPVAAAALPGPASPASH